MSSCLCLVFSQCAMFTAELGLSRFAECGASVVYTAVAASGLATLARVVAAVTQRRYTVRAGPQLACSDVVTLSPVIMATTRTLGLTPASPMPHVDT